MLFCVYFKFESYFLIDINDVVHMSSKSILSIVTFKSIVGRKALMFHMNQIFFVLILHVYLVKDCIVLLHEIYSIGCLFEYVCSV
jgi:hypothetical protein